MATKRQRTFLEPAANDVDSYVVTEIGEHYAELKLADCERNVRLYFYFRTDKKRAAARLKVARLRQALDRIEAAIDAAPESGDLTDE